MTGVALPAAGVASTGDGLTRRLAALGASWRFADLPADVVARARHAILDWLGVAVAGAHEPPAVLVREALATEAGPGEVTLLGTAERAPLRRAALVNGTAGHALDYDDVQKTMRGHPTAPLLPAALALAEARGLSGAALIEAFVAGFEIETRIGAVAGESHYAAGWHSTATIGTFGAAVAAGRLLGLDAAGLARAIGIAATEAAGLKALFGTMCKPLHAGRAAEAGLLAALLAARGFTARDDALECEQGFLATQSPAPDWQQGLVPADVFHLRQALFKFHAACYGTHAPIEAMRRLIGEQGVMAERIRSFEVRLPSRYLAVCNITRPRTALEVKFSLVFTCAMAALGRDTADPASFGDATGTEPALAGLAARGSVVGDDSMDGASAVVTVTLDDGAIRQAAADVTAPITDLGRQQAAVERKFRALVAPRLGAERADAIVGLIDRLDGLESVTTLAAACAGSARHE